MVATNLSSTILEGDGHFLQVPIMYLILLSFRICDISCQGVLNPIQKVIKMRNFSIESSPNGVVVAAMCLL